MKILFIAMLASLIGGAGQAQINVALLHQLVDNSRSENSRQTDLRDKQALSTSYEQVNSMQSKQLKNAYRNIQKRFSSVGMAIEAVQIGLEAIPLVSKIASDQQRLILLCKNYPSFALLALETQIDFADRSEMLARYLYGLALSLGDLNAMSRSDRRILSGFVITELSAISLNLCGLIASLQAARRKVKPIGVSFSDEIPRDKQLVESIFSRMKALK